MIKNVQEFKETLKFMFATVKSYMPGSKKSHKMSEDEKRMLFQKTVETLYATNQSWRTILLEKSWAERIYLIQQKKKIETILQEYKNLTKG
jgi:hypothetical protein